MYPQDEFTLCQYMLASVEDQIRFEGFLNYCSKMLYTYLTEVLPNYLCASRLHKDIK